MTSVTNSLIALNWLIWSSSSVRCQCLKECDASQHFLEHDVKNTFECHTLWIMDAHTNYEGNNFTHWQNYSHLRRSSSQFVSNGRFVVRVWRKLNLALLFRVRASVDRIMAQKRGVVANKCRDPFGFPIIAGGFNRRECSCKHTALFAQARMAL